MDHEHDWSHDEVIRLKQETDGHLAGVLRACMTCGAVRWFHDENSGSDPEKPINVGCLIEFKAITPV